ncbi:hypothetical protein LOZ53_003946 [Ophidiomyces ophidiicola]|nr:hypothetical protein LOZ55_003533 [Ophidiomyces ophidiicola]KAI1988120.1 hypothetical protein LOZ54_003366 [Ophidiomyces ophidiicola]KAI1988381.1 hypothetical protein LOZ53_003946 [Ophidiomyces ophidiicola]KAI1996984.1 hypothetical protein LOZ51_003147 [Ophidiomyces ophidiicola]
MMLDLKGHAFYTHPHTTLLFLYVLDRVLIDGRSCTPTQPTLAYPRSKPDPLVNWIKGLGGHLDDAVEIYTDPVGGQCLRVRNTFAGSFPSGASVASCPIKAMMSLANLEDGIEGLPLHDFLHPPEFLPAVGNGPALAFFLMDQYFLGDKSFWAPYIQSLPKDRLLTRLEYYSKEDLEWLEGTNLLAIRENSLKDLKVKYETGIQVLKQSPNINLKNYTWERFVWAFSIIMSRSFTSEILKDFFEKHPHIGNVRDNFFVLVPLVDVTNHYPLAKVEWRITSTEINLVVEKSFKPGEEIFNNYGPRSNERLMTGYGFCIPGNVCDYRDFVLSPPEGSPLYQAKEKQTVLFPDKKTDNDKCYIYNIFFPFSEQRMALETLVISSELFEAAAVLSVNDRESADLRIEKDRIYVMLSKYGNSRCYYDGLGQIIAKLVHTILILKGSPYLKKGPKNRKQQNAQFYREAQIYMCECATVILQWSLLRATLPDNSPVLGEINQEKLLQNLPKELFGRQVRERARFLLQNYPSAFGPSGELFYGDNVSRTLTKQVEEPFKTFSRNLRGIWDNITHVAKLKLVYTVFICFCAAAYNNIDDYEVSKNGQDSILTKRLRRWVPFLSEQWPEPQQDERWSTEEGGLIEELLDSVETKFNETWRDGMGLFSPLKPFTRRWRAATQKNWLSGSRLRWAWTIVSEERVGVVKDPFSILNDAGEQTMQTAKEVVFEPYLYIPFDSEETVTSN